MKIFTENEKILIENHIFKNAIERVFEADYYNEDINNNLNTYIEQLETDTVDLQLEENLSGIFEMEYNNIAPMYEAPIPLGGQFGRFIKDRHKQIELRDQQKRDKKYNVGQKLPTRKETAYDNLFKTNYPMKKSYQFAREHDNLGKFGATKRVVKQQLGKTSNFLGKMRQKVGRSTLSRKLKNVVQRKKNNYGVIASKMKVKQNKAIRGASIFKRKLTKK